MSRLNVGQRVWVVVPGDRFSGKVVEVWSEAVVVDDGVGTEWEVQASGSGGMWLENEKGAVIYGNEKAGGRAWAERKREAESIRSDYGGLRT